MINYRFELTHSGGYLYENDIRDLEYLAELRMNGGKTIPFCLETSMESSFQIQLEPAGIKFSLIDNFYINRDLGKVFSEAFHDLDIFPFQLDSLLKEEVEKEGINPIMFNKILEFMKSQLKPQIAYTYYGMIKSLMVEEKRFFLNGVEFYVVNH